MGDIVDMPAGEYHADPCEQPSLSASIANILLNQSAAHARAVHPRLNPDYERVAEDRFDLGTVAHALFLEGKDAVEVVDAPDWRTKDAREQRDVARSSGRIPLLRKDWHDVHLMCEGLRAQVAALDPPLFTDGKAEQTVIWTDNGVQCRARLDWLRDDYSEIHDLKTTRASAKPGAWERTMFNMGADVQARFYQRGVAAVTGVEPEFRFVAVETHPPYALAIFSLSPSAAALADAKIERALETWKACLAADVWPPYTTKVCFVEPPAWAEAQWLEEVAA